MGFPNPQQFQLSIFKEESGAVRENPPVLLVQLKIGLFPTPASLVWGFLSCLLLQGMLGLAVLECLVSSFE